MIGVYGGDNDSGVQNAQFCLGLLLFGASGTFKKKSIACISFNDDVLFYFLKKLKILRFPRQHSTPQVLRTRAHDG